MKSLILTIVVILVAVTACVFVIDTFGLLLGGILAGVISGVALSAGDIINKRFSAKQLLTNIVICVTIFSAFNILVFLMK